MKIGDKVRFLSETGGGRVAGFQGKGIVLVEDADGFEIPFPINDVVVVSDEDYSSRHEVEVKKQGDAPDTRSLKERLADNGGEEQPDSDIDLLVRFDRKNAKIGLFKYASIIIDLENLLHRKVDLVEEGALLPFAERTANKDKMAQQNAQ